MSEIKKYTIFVIIIFACVICIGINSYAVNEGISIVESEEEDTYWVYIHENETKQFEFAYTNDKNVDKTTLRYLAYAQDEVGNKMAYVNSKNNSVFDSTTYMYARIINTSNYILNGIEIDLGKEIKLETLEEASNITKQIPVKTDESDTKTEERDGKRISLTKGKIILTDKSKNYECQTIKVLSNSNYSDFVDLADMISKFSSSTNVVTKVESYVTFLKQYENLKPTNGWTTVKNNEIFEPEDAKEGDVYVVWMKETGTNLIDLQIMTAKKEYSEEKIREQLKDLPITGDEDILFIVLGVMIVGTVVLIIARKKQKLFNTICIVLVIGIIAVGGVIAQKYIKLSLNDTKLEDIVAEIEKEFEEFIIINNSENLDNDEFPENNTIPKIDKKIEGSDVIGIITIPAINLKYPIINETNKRTLELSVTLFNGEKLNEIGNVVIAGHNYRNGSFFGKLNKLKVGDTIEVTDDQGITLTYKITEKRVVRSSDTGIVIPEREGERELTLFTCINGKSNRLVIKAFQEV